MIATVAIVVLLLVVALTIFINQPSFGKLPAGERLTRIEQSPNYKNGKFQNRLPTTQITSDKPKLQSLYEFLFRKVKDLAPAKDLPSVKTDLKALNPDDEVLVWMGHSSLYMQTDGKRIAIDPVLVSASPVSFFNKAFKGTENYHPQDLPDLDYLIITHDHWDHLDYNTIKNLKNRTGKIICPLGVGEHLEYWGVDPSKIIELDWNESTQLDNKIKITALPARHFSGRGLSPDKTLWASYMLQSSSGNIYLSGDTGYDIHFQDIKKRFGTIDFAIMENGQYNKDWKDIHIMPEELVKAIKELDPKRVMTIHNSKFALSTHTWHEPMDKIAKAAEENSFKLITPMIGEPVHLKDSAQTFTKWWKK